VTGKGPAPSVSAGRATGVYVLWLGEFDTVDQAERLRAQLAARGWKAVLAGTRSETGSTHRVEIGAFASRETADGARDQLRAQGHRGQVVYKFSP
jgi:DedD protein